MPDHSSQTAYKTAAIYYVSGTGNTFRAAEWMKGHAHKAGAAARLVSAAGSLRPPPEDDAETHLAGFMAPAHGFITIWAMLVFALGRPRVRRCHAFVIHTRAGLKLGPLFVPGVEGVGGYLMAAILWMKGYSVRGVMGLDMPSNWMSLHPGLRPANAEAIIARAEAKVERFAARILGGGRAFWSQVAFLGGVALLPVTAAYLFMGRFFLAKMFFASYRCDNCYLCVNICPHGGVIRPGEGERPYWTYECESCMRCMAYCPRVAIEAGHSIGVILAYVTAIPAGAAVFAALTARFPWIGRGEISTAIFLTNFIFGLAAMYLCYLAIYKMLDIGAVNRMFTFTTLTHWYRRYHEPGTKLGAMVKLERGKRPGAGPGGKTGGSP